MKDIRIKYFNGPQKWILTKRQLSTKTKKDCWIANHDCKF